MGNLNKFKIFTFSALLLQLVVSFILFAQIQNLSVLSDLNTGKSFIFILILLIILISFILFILVMLLIKKSQLQEQLNEKKEIVIENISKETEEVVENVSEDINVEYYLKKLIPKEDSKMNLKKYTEKILSNFAKEFDIVQGLFFIKDKNTGEFSIAGKYAYFGETEPENFKIGETLSGQVAKNMNILYLSEIPENYVTILSGLGSSSPNQLIIVPVINNNETIAIIEFASFKEFKKSTQKLLEAVSLKIGESLIKY